MSLPRHLLSALSLLFIALNLMLWCVPLLLLAIVRLMVPGARSATSALMNGIYRIAVKVNDWWFWRVLNIKWPRPDLGLQKDQMCIVIANHQSWTDIFLIQSLLARNGPIVKFLTKRELLYIPILGMIIWAYDFPALRRRTNPGQDHQMRVLQDKQRITQACRIIRNAPCALLTFPEGTRFTDAKQRQSNSPYKHLLKARGGGFAAMCEGLNQQATTIVDITIAYPKRVSFWVFLGGALPGVAIHVDRLVIPKLEGQAAAAWLSDRWRQKDQRLTRMLSAAFDQAYTEP